MAQRRYRQIMLLVAQTVRPRRCYRQLAVLAVVRADDRQGSLPVLTVAPKRRRSMDCRYEKITMALAFYMMLSTC